MCQLILKYVFVKELFVLQVFFLSLHLAGDFLSVAPQNQIKYCNLQNWFILDKYFFVIAFSVFASFFGH